MTTAPAHASTRAEPTVPGVQVLGPPDPAWAQILTPDALSFLAKLARSFEGRRRQLLARRVARQSEIFAGHMPDFLPETRDVREGDEWLVEMRRAVCGIAQEARRE